MKTKNILRIGVLSIVLLTLLISPILKPIISQVNAETPSISISAYCLGTVGPGSVGPNLTNSSDAAEYIGKCCNTEYEWGAASQTIIDSNCQQAQNTIDSDSQVSPDDGSYWGGDWDLQTIIEEVKPEEEKTKEICDNIGRWDKCEIEGTTTLKWLKSFLLHFGCVLSQSFIRGFCIMLTSFAEGLGKLFSSIMNVEISWILYALSPQTYQGFVHNAGVQEVWSFVRDLVNMFLILGTIGIGIATILGSKKYGWKKILWKLIIVALLVNFSLVIAGMMLDVSNFLSYHFLNMSQEENTNLGEAMMAGFGYKDGVPPEVLGEGKVEVTQFTDNSIEEIAKKSEWLVIGQFLVVNAALILIGLFAVIALFAVFVAMIVRAFLIIFLLAVSPGAFAAWIFPETESFWKMWWQQFIKWCTFPVIFAFMLYLGIFAIQGLEAGETGLIASVIQIFLFSMFLVGGLIFSVQGGGATAQIVMKQASVARAATGKFLGYKTLSGVTGSKTWKKTQEKLEKSGLKPMHGLGNWMGEQPKKVRENELKQIQESYKNKSDGQIRHDMKVYKNDKSRVAAGENQLIERGKIDYEKDSEFIEIARNEPGLNIPKLKKVNPELYTEYFTKPEEMKKETTKIERQSPGITKEQVKNRAITNLMVDQVIKSSSDNIKLGNWANISDRLEKKEEDEQFFGELFDRQLEGKKLAAMINSMDDTDKQTKFIDRIKKLRTKRINANSYQDVIEDFKTRGYRKNPVLRAAFDL